MELTVSGTGFLVGPAVGQTLLVQEMVKSVRQVQVLQPSWAGKV